jgi:PAS domain S-box-containing protein
MNELVDPRLVRFCSLATSISGLLAVGVGLIVLVGWNLRILPLLTWGLTTPMPPNAAACSVLVGLSLWVLRTNENPNFAHARHLAVNAALTLVGLINALTFTEYVFNLNFSIDRLLLVTAPSLATTGLRVRMSPLAAAIFILLGLALLTIDWRTRRGDWPAQFLAFGAMMVAAFASLGILLGPGMTPVTLALPAVLTYLSLPAGIICARSTWALGGLVTSNSQGARLLRKVVPAALFVLSLIGLFLSKPLLTNAHFNWPTVGLLGLICSLLLVGLLFWIASIIDQGETERTKIEQAQHLSPEQLDRLLGRTEEPIDDAQLRRAVTLGLSFAILLMSLLGFLSWRVAQQAGVDADWVSRAREVSTALEVTLRHLVDVETGGRGFAETGSEPFLEPYELGAIAIIQDLRQLHLLIVDPIQVQHLAVLQSVTDGAVDATREIVAERKKAGNVPPVIFFERGKHAMDAARVAVADMELREVLILNQRTQNSAAARKFNLLMTTLGSLLGVILLSFAAAMIVREIGVSSRVRAQLKATNTDLERRIAERTEAVQESLARSKQALKQLEQQKFALDEHAIVAITDVQGCITYVNDKFCTLSGYTRAELIGQNHRILNSGHHSKEFFLEMYRNIASGKVWHAEIKNRAKDGSFYWVDTTVVPFMEGTKPHQYIAIRADITERKQAENELLKLHREVEVRNLELEEQTVELQRTRDEMERRVIMRTKDLAKANETLATSNIELQQFAYVASHDLQSPLRGISGFVQLLQMDYEEKLDDQGRDYIRRTVQSIAHMQSLIRDLLDYSRVDARSRPFVPVPLMDVFQSAVSLLGSSIRDAGGQVTCDALPVVYGDGSQLAQVMQNLIGNGLKYHGTEPPHVHVSAQADIKTDEWIVSVADNGIGIDPKYSEHIFEIFKRLHDRKEYPGTGIGLAVCRRVVERHGGAIWVESVPGHGSNFRFRIPSDAAKSTGKDETNDQQSYQHETG